MRLVTGVLGLIVGFAAGVAGVLWYERDPEAPQFNRDVPVRGITRAEFERLPKAELGARLFATEASRYRLNNRHWDRYGASVTFTEEPRRWGSFLCQFRTFHFSPDKKPHQRFTVEEHYALIASPVRPPDADEVDRLCRQLPADHPEIHGDPLEIERGLKLMSAVLAAAQTGALTGPLECLDGTHIKSVHDRPRPCDATAALRTFRIADVQQVQEDTDDVSDRERDRLRYRHTIYTRAKVGPGKCGDPTSWMIEIESSANMSFGELTIGRVKLNHSKIC